MATSLQAQAVHPLAIETVRISELKLDEHNPRIHRPAHLRRIAASIEATGYNAPVLIDREGVVLSGNGRVKACLLLGLFEIPAIRLEHLTPAQARAFSIAENRLVEAGEWDKRILGQHFQSLAAMDLDFSIEITGFETGEIDLMIEGLDLDGSAGNADDAPTEPAAVVVSRAGDIWTLGRHHIACADALQSDSYALLMGDERADVVFTDPPYNVPVHGHVSGKGKRRHREFAMASGEMSDAQFATFLTRAIQQLAAFSRDGSVHFICMDWRHVFPLLAAARGSYDDLLNLCVWAKNNGGMGSLYRSAHELVAVFRKGPGPHRNNVELGRHGRNRTNVWNYPGANSFVRTSEEGDLLAQHPTPKPVQLISDALLDVSARGDVVLDPFLGSGSTLIAAERVGRTCFGLDLDPAYVDLAIRRWERLSGDQAVHSVTGESFAHRLQELTDGQA